jgi:branched-chain amino acid transport system substrate-binding protein
MKKTLIALALPALLALTSTAALADLTIGVSLPLTGPASGLGIPVNNGFKLWPETIGGEKVKLIVLDDATDPTNGVKNTRRFVTEDKVDLIIGSAATPVAVAMAGVAAETQTVQIAMSPIPLPEGKDTWSFRLAHSSNVMAHAVVKHMLAQGVKSVGFLGYTDAYGETWLQAMNQELGKAGLKPMSAVERFQRTDTGVTAQALKLTSAKPDAILVVASGSGAAMPHTALVERGYRGKIYQTHAAASRDLVRVGGKAVEGAFVVSGPATVAEQLPASNPSKGPALQYVQAYERLYGPGSRNQFGAHTFDAMLLLEKAVPVALKKAKPGTPEFRAALKEAIEGLGKLPVSQGVLAYSATDHWGFTNDTGIVMKVVAGDWKLEP